MKVVYKFSSDEKTLFKYANDIENGTFIFCNSNKRLYIKMNGKIVEVTSSKEEMARRKNKVYNCKNCGAPMKMVDKYSSLLECKYCGTIQDIDD